MVSGVFIGLALIVLFAGWRALAGLRGEIRPPGLSDEAIQRIRDEGTFHDPAGEPLDLDRIREEEEEFWEEPWDEPDPY